jgi:low temperature requirement protein LtrA
VAERTVRRLYRPMVARDTGEHHRVATPLELFFDLCFVVAVGQASAVLHHELSAGRVGVAVVKYGLVFFAIWWGWVNAVWFASAYDTDDDLYRLTTFVQILGALVLAAGVPRAADHGDYGVVTAGYVIMRLALVTQWLRAAASDPPRRPAALRFAVGVTVVQAGWVARLALPGAWYLAGFVALGVAELAVPVWAELAAHTTWNPEHIVDRYRLFTMIVLGESVLSATLATQTALEEGGSGVGLLVLAASGLAIVFAMWWLYFDRSPQPLLTSLPRGFAWGYGHYAVFASATALGAGLAVAVDRGRHVGHLSDTGVGYAVAVPVALYLLSLWVLHVLPLHRGAVAVAYPVAAAVVLAAPLGPAPVPVTALVLAALVATDIAATPRGRPR